MALFFGTLFICHVIFIALIYALIADRGPESITGDIKLSTLKPRHANIMSKLYPTFENRKKKTHNRKWFSRCWDNSGSHWEHANA